MWSYCMQSLLIHFATTTMSIRSSKEFCLTFLEILWTFTYIVFIISIILIVEFVETYCCNVYLAFHINRKELLDHLKVYKVYCKYLLFSICIITSLLAAIFCSFEYLNYVPERNEKLKNGKSTRNQQG